MIHRSLTATTLGRLGPSTISEQLGAFPNQRRLPIVHLVLEVDYLRRLIALEYNSAVAHDDDDDENCQRS